MKEFLKTAFEYTKYLQTTGAVSETSVHVVKEITKHVDQSKKQIIVEYGSGLGNVTKGILNKMHKDSILYAFEVNEEFCQALNSITDERLHIINLSVDQANKGFLKPSFVDCIISTIPFTLISDRRLTKILELSHHILKIDGFIMQVLYSGLHMSKFKKYFQNCKLKVIKNFPIALVYEGQKIIAAS